MKCEHANITGGDIVPYGMSGAQLPEYAECDNPAVPEDEIDNLPCDETCPYFEQCITPAEVVARIAELEKLLPCKVGDTVYYCKGNIIESATVTSISRRWDKECWNVHLGVMEIPLLEFLNFFYLTYAAAEAALKRQIKPIQR